MSWNGENVPIHTGDSATDFQSPVMDALTAVAFAFFPAVIWKGFLCNRNRKRQHLQTFFAPQDTL